jgi:hypothetical protein
MACCLIALMLFAQCMATLRRWGAFWGLVPVPEGIEYDSVYVRAGRWMSRPEVRIAVAAVVAIELAALGSWIYADHRDHIAMIAAHGWQRVTGHKALDAPICRGSDRSNRVRLVLDAGPSGLHRFN